MAKTATDVSRSTSSRPWSTCMTENGRVHVCFDVLALADAGGAVSRMITKATNIVAATIKRRAVVKRFISITVLDDLDFEPGCAALFDGETIATR